VNEIYNIDLNMFDCVYSGISPIDEGVISHFPNVLFIFGPHFWVLPTENNKLDVIKGFQEKKNKNVVFNLLSEWVCSFVKCFKETRNIRFIKLPFGVDTDKFKENPLIEKTEVFVYYKQRHPEELQFILNNLNSRNISYRVFDYTNTYSEEEYIEYLQKSKYGIWIGRHESQGFALQEALSCNVPLCVWNVLHMDQTFGYSFFPYSATTVPYWDSRCGEVFCIDTYFSTVFDKFLTRINENDYSPREFVLENLSMEVCEKKLTYLIEDHKSGRLGEQI
jgi:glycosyltransferase involved in cell wall biosynthesis